MGPNEAFDRASVVFYRMEDEETPKEGPKLLAAGKVLDGEVVEPTDEDDEFEDDLDKAVSLLKGAADWLDYYSDFELSKGIVLLEDRMKIRKELLTIEAFLKDMEPISDVPPNDINYKIDVKEDETDPKPLKDHPTHCPHCGQKNIVDPDQLQAVYCPGVQNPDDWKDHYFVGLVPKDDEMSEKDREVAERVLSNLGLD